MTVKIYAYLSCENSGDKLGLNGIEVPYKDPKMVKLDKLTLKMDANVGLSSFLVCILFFECLGATL